MAAKSEITDAQRTPPAGVAKQAERGLKLHDEHGRGGTDVGHKRALQLKNRERVSDVDIKSMYSYFARHEVDKQGEGWADRKAPSAGYIAWLLWGGEPAKRWISRLHDRLERLEAA